MKSTIDGQDPSSSERQPETVAKAIDRHVALARLAVFWEHLLPALAPGLAVIAAFVGISWMGIWPQLPLFAHICLLFLFFLALVWAGWSLRVVRWPDRETARRRVETASGLVNRPLETLEDTLGSGAARAETRALWTAHRERALRTLGQLRFRWPAPRLDRKDPFAIRIIAVIVLYMGAFVGYGAYWDRLGDAFRFERGVEDAGLRIDAWVTPPAYTGHPPIFLDLERSADADPIRIPEGSVATIRIQGTDDPLQVAHVTEEGETIVAALDPQGQVVLAAARTGDGVRPAFTTHEVTLDEDAAVAIASGNSALARWPFQVVPDRSPEISLSEPPEVQLSGAIKLTYAMQDDYGVIGANAELMAKDESFTVAAERSEVRPLVEAPVVKLSLPQRRTKSGSSQTFRDLTAHPWAGSIVDIRLSARDEAGQTGLSEVVEFRLPMRSFSKAMARAIVEQRRNLALDANRRLQVLDAMDALMIAPERFIDDASIYLGMRYVYKRLQEAEDDEALIGTLDMMWDLALAIEDGDLSLAERALRQAEEALRRALENGASDEEIERLTQELREAMNEYFRALAEQMQRNPQNAQPMDPNARVLRQQDLDEMLNQIEDLARTGAHDAAREMLSQMQQMLENLRAGRPQMQQGRSASEMSDALNQLGEMIQRQRELMDESFQLDQQSRRQGQQNGQGQREGQNREGRNGQGGQPRSGQQNGLAEQLAEALRQLEQGQGDLRNSLQELLQQLERDGIRGNEALDDAGRSMGRAADALGQGEPGEAVGPQGDALQALQQGTRGLIEQMINQGQGQGTADGRGNQRNTDPLGRPYRNAMEDDGGSVKVPEMIDIQRARRILRELREKLGDPLRSETERNYFERLLTPY